MSDKPEKPEKPVLTFPTALYRNGESALVADQAHFDTLIKDGWSEKPSHLPAPEPPSAGHLPAEPPPHATQLPADPDDEDPPHARPKPGQKR